jgi:hypothetical protein
MMRKLMMRKLMMRKPMMGKVRMRELTMSELRMMRSFVLIAAIGLMPQLASAQRGAAFHAAAPRTAMPHPISPARNSAFARDVRSEGFRRSTLYLPYASLPFPFFADALDDGDIYSTGYPVSSQPPPYVLEAAREMFPRQPNVALPASSSRETSASQPLMIELQNGHYVRVTSTAADGEAPELEAPELEAHDVSSSKVPPSAASPAIMNPVTLLFRDGHTEEVHDYTIADGFLYARGDYYTDGYWNKKIDLATLNIPQTLQANGERHVNFVLPSSPNEVITRP